MAAIEVRALGEGDEAVLDRVGDGVFDRAVGGARAAALLRAPHHHLVVAVEDGTVVGFGTAVDHLRPDKPAELWIDEIGVATGHRRRGLGKRLLAALLEAGRDAGCAEAWLLAGRANVPARALYASMGGRETADPQVLCTFDLGVDG